MLKRIIVIDDDLEDIQIMKECIALMGDDYVCEAFVDPCEALNYLQGVTSIPFLIVIDIHMPGMNGEQCIDQIGKIKNLAIVLVAVYSSAIPSNETLSIFKKAGAVFFQKPSSYAELQKGFKELITLSLNKSKKKA